MTFKRDHFAVAATAQTRDLRAQVTHFFAAALLLAGAAAFTSASLGAEVTSEDSSANQVFELPQSVGSGQGKEFSVLVDESYLKMATLTLRQGTTLPSHSTPVPTTIQVLEGEGEVHIGSRLISVSGGTLVSLVAGEAHSVVPKPGSDMLLLVHYLRGGEPDNLAAGSQALERRTGEALLGALNDERHAQAVYQAVMNQHGKVRPFSNIIKAEEQHENLLLDFFDEYDLEVPADAWAERTLEVPETMAQACAVGVEAEKDNIAMYDGFLEFVEEPEVRDLFTRLRDASAERHQPAFERCADGRWGRGGGRDGRRGSG